MDKKINPSILSLIGFLAIIAFAVASDRLVVSLYRWFMRSTETIAYTEFLWAQSLQVLLFAIIFMLFSWLVLSRARPNQIVAFVFIITGLVLDFYPMLYMFTSVGQTALFIYLTTYHSSLSSIFPADCSQPLVSFSWQVTGVNRQEETLTPESGVAAGMTGRAVAARLRARK
jgi:hypothetical protein